jgi:hypothetical protein
VHERRNFILVLLLIGSAVWAVGAWLMAGEGIATATAVVWTQRVAALLTIVGAGLFLAWAMLAEDKLPDHLRAVAGELYYEAGGAAAGDSRSRPGGLCFMPVVRRSSKGTAELCIYYQNRFENPVSAVVHLRPPLDSFVIREGMRDAHFAFRASGGDFGCIRQPIAVPRHLQGEVVAVELAAACHYPRGQGSCLRRQAGLSCGSLNIDWHGAAFKSGVHEVCGEIELVGPTTLHLSMPTDVPTRARENSPWRQEQISAGVAA